VVKRKMCPGVSGIEGCSEGHDAWSKAHALAYLEARGLAEAARQLRQVPKSADPHGQYLGAGAFVAMRGEFGSMVCNVLAKLGSAEERRRRVLVVDSDLGGSCGLKAIREKCPEVYVKSGVMERGNFSACAGFGFADSERQGVFGTFAAFQEMILSEVTMARLNRCNVLCHFSHSGVDYMADNTCHFGINNMFADNGLETEPHLATQLFFPADVHQMQKVVEAVFWEQGLRFIYTARSTTPEILTEEGKPFFGGDYEFQKGKDDVLLKAGPDCGYVVSYGDALYRAHDAVLQLRSQGLQVGLVNKCHVNVPDEEMLSLVGKASFVLVVESQSTKTGLGVRMGTWLLERGLAPKFERAGTHLDGCGGLWEHAYHQGYDPKSLVARIQNLSNSVQRT